MYNFQLNFFLCSCLLVAPISAYFYFQPRLPSQSWNYDNPDVWPLTIPSCKGMFQSPIALDTSDSIFDPYLEVELFNYAKTLTSPITVTNNGRSVEINIPNAKDGSIPFVKIGEYWEEYEVNSVHFHWGSQGVKGSEHVIDGRRFDAEMHIVHTNSRFDGVEKARNYPDGLVVISVLLEGSSEPEESTSLNEIFNTLDQVRRFNSSATIEKPISLESLLPNLESSEFFAYRGSLTTPPCSEALTWLVFADPIPVSTSDLQKFWDISEKRGLPLLNNFRSLQIANRPVFRANNIFSHKY